MDIKKELCPTLAVDLCFYYQGNTAVWFSLQVKIQSKLGSASFKEPTKTLKS